MFENINKKFKLFTTKNRRKNNEIANYLNVMKDIEIEDDNEDELDVLFD